jgi:hypothetical protein
MNGFGHPNGASMPIVLAPEQCCRSQSGCDEAEFPCPTYEMACPSITQTPQSRGLAERPTPTNLNLVHVPSSRVKIVQDTDKDIRCKRAIPEPPLPS